jgi:dTDP-4-dehydrorhamnose reductase
MTFDSTHVTGTLGKYPIDEIRMTRVIVVGATGMLGAMLVDVLARKPGLTVTATGRDTSLLEKAARLVPDVRWLRFDAADDDYRRSLDGHDWVINAIGLIKPYVRDGVMQDVEQAIRVNAIFPHHLARAAASVGARVVQIATDCVYSGRRGRYVESDAHDPEDVYGKTKSLGEVAATHVLNLRCSIIGPELRGHRSLLDWFRSQPRGAKVNGFTNHRWNGVTTLQFAELTAAIVHGSVRPPGLQHVVPEDDITKAELLRAFARAFDRSDMEIADSLASQPVDRTLATQHDDTNRSLWQAAGYSAPPTVPSMVDRLAAFDSRLLNDVPTLIA